MLSTLRFILDHPLSSRRPLAALGRYAWWQTISRVQGSVVYEWIDGSKLLVKNGMTGATGNIYCGLHEFSDMAFVMHFLLPNDLFVDVGANVGSYTILASVVCGADTISVEPDPETMKNLRANIDANLVAHRVEFVESALGAKNGTANLTMGLDTMNRVVTAGVGTRSVPLMKLDDVVKGRQPILLKMDVEGYEEQVLAGATVVLRQPSLLAILSEGDTPQIGDCFERNGFRKYSYDAFNRALKIASKGTMSTSANALYVRDPEAVELRLKNAKKRKIIGVEI